MEQIAAINQEIEATEVQVTSNSGKQLEVGVRGNRIDTPLSTMALLKDQSYSALN